MSDTGNMWANMLGLGPLFSTINDPAFQLHIRQLVESIQATAERCQRIEHKLDLLIAELGGDGSSRNFGGYIEPVRPFEPVRLADVSGRVGADGAGTSSVTGGSFDDGTCHDTPGGAGAASRSGNGAGPDRPMRVGGGAS